MTSEKPWIDVENQQSWINIQLPWQSLAFISYLLVIAAMVACLAVDKDPHRRRTALMIVLLVVLAFIMLAPNVGPATFVSALNVAAIEVVDPLSHAGIPPGANPFHSFF